MSFILIIVFILIVMSSPIILEEDVTEDVIKWDRICKENKDYVDASVMFRNTFWVIIGNMYYEFSWDQNPFAYKAEGVQETFLKEYDDTWTVEVQDRVQEGRFLGGFYHHWLPHDEDHANLDVDKHPYFDPRGFEEAVDNPNTDHTNGIMSVGLYNQRLSKIQLVAFKDEHNNKDKYHIKRRFNEDGLREADTDLFLPHGVPPRGNLESLLTSSVPLPPRLESLPMVFDYLTLHLYVIINQKSSGDSPRLYYNHLKYEDFKNNWKYVNIPKGYRYNAFIPNMMARVYGTEPARETPYEFIFGVIAEPFRDTTVDQTRGPSIYFVLERNNKTGIPSGLRNMKKSGMDVFKCKFVSPSSTILYWAFGIIIGILLTILVGMLCFVSFNFFLGKERVVIVRHKRNTIDGKPISLDRSGLRRRIAKDDTKTSLDDKRSASVQSVDQMADKKIKL